MLKFEVPSQVIFGRSVADKVGMIAQEINIRNALIICDQGVKAAGIVTPVIQSLEDAGIAVRIFAEITANPSDTLVTEAVKFAKKLSVDALVAVGGGSSLDAAKAINILLTNPGPIRSYEGMNQVKCETLPLISIPTTSGTGSEVTSFSIITDSVNSRKMVIGGRYVGSRIAILDPELTFKLPAGITAATGMDALTHAIEAHFSTASSVMSDVNALKAIELLYTNLETATNNGRDIKARESVMMGSLLAGFAFNSALLGLAHAIAHPLGAVFDVPHGVANAMVLPYVVAFNGQECKRKAINIGIAMGVEPEVAGAAYLEQKILELTQKIGIPRLREYIEKSDFQVIVEATLKESSLQTNPRKVEGNDVFAILENAF